MKHSLSTNLKNEEFWNVVTHGLGALASVGALIYMVQLGMNSDYEYGAMAVGIFGASLVTTYSASAFYHLYTFLKGHRNLKLRIFDHMTIYYLIAGSYTPFALLSMPPENGWYLFKLGWFLAILGTVYKAIFFGTSEYLSIALYVVMGWLILLDYQTFVEYSTPEMLFFLKAGGAAYMIGIIFYANEKIYFNHVIWHLFVMAGSALHVTAVLTLFR